MESLPLAGTVASAARPAPSYDPPAVDVAGQGNRIRVQGLYLPHEGACFDLAGDEISAWHVEVVGGEPGGRQHDLKREDFDVPMAQERFVDATVGVRVVGVRRRHRDGEGPGHVDELIPEKIGRAS